MIHEASSQIVQAPASLRGMLAFVALVDAGSFSAAADRLQLTPSSVSKLITRLEEHLGAQLVKRTTRTMQLTEVGQTYLTNARRVLEELDTLQGQMQNTDPRPKGMLRVTAPTVLGHVRVLPVVLAFQQENPDLQVHLDLSDRIVDVIGERIDVAIRVTLSPPASFVARKLDDDLRVLCASPDYLQRRGSPRSPDDLAAHDCILCAADRRGATWQFRKAPKDDDVTTVIVSGPLIVGNTLSLHDAVVAGFGIADLPRYLVEDDLRVGRLVSVLPRFVINERSIFALYAPSRFTPPKVRFFVEALRRGFVKKGLARPAV
ncbi:MAG TPA: LysR family transcriptional regulator [Polyangiaceae bacterium]